jgi:hypothetical protein
MEPLPKTGMDPMAAPKTSVLAKNDELDWSAEIGDDAELLAIAKAAGAHPARGRRQLLMAGVIFLVLAVLIGAFFGRDISEMVDRAMSGKKLRNGAIVVKTIPSGAKVVLDGEDRGKTNLKLTGIDPDKPHQLVVTPVDMDPIMVEFTTADFVNTEDLPTYFWTKDFSKKDEPAAEDAGPVAEEPKKKPTKKPSKRRGRKGRRRR